METTFDFSVALEKLKHGGRVARTGWNGKGQFVRMFMPYSDQQFKVSEVEPTDGTLMGHLLLKNAQNQLVPWIPSNGDLVADDWHVVEKQ